MNPGQKDLSQRIFQKKRCNAESGHSPTHGAFGDARECRRVRDLQVCEHHPSGLVEGQSIVDMSVTARMRLLSKEPDVGLVQ